MIWTFTALVLALCHTTLAALLRGDGSAARGLAAHPIEPFEFNHLNLTSPSELFRFKLDKNATSGKLKLWMENRRTKDQWEAAVDEDVSSYGPVGVPHHALFHFLEKALAQHDVGGTAPVEDTPITKVDVSVQCAIMNNGFVTLTLTLVMSSLWNNEYKFLLEPRKVELIDVLKSKLVDAEEAIANLQKRVFVSITGTGDASGVSWYNEISDFYSPLGAEKAIQFSKTVGGTSNNAFRVSQSGTYYVSITNTYTSASTYNFRKVEKGSLSGSPSQGPGAVIFESGIDYTLFCSSSCSVTVTMILMH